MLLRWDNMVDYSTAYIDFLWHHFFQISRPITVKISSDMGQFQSDTDEPLLFAGQWHLSVHDTLKPIPLCSIHSLPRKTNLTQPHRHKV